MTPAFPPLNLQLATSSKSGDINAPNTVTFGSFGAPTVAGAGGMLPPWWPLLAIGAAVLFLSRRK